MKHKFKLLISFFGPFLTFAVVLGFLCDRSPNISWGYASLAAICWLPFTSWAMFAICPEGRTGNYSTHIPVIATHIVFYTMIGVFGIIYHVSSGVVPFDMQTDIITYYIMGMLDILGLTWLIGIDNIRKFETAKSLKTCEPN